MYNQEELYQALRNADAAGDVEGAKRIAQYIEQSSQQEAPKPQFDREMGAPLIDRAGAGTLKQEDRQAFWENKYGAGNVQPDGDNFIVTEGDKQFYVNPEGLDFGDVAEYGRVGAEVVGGALGGALGAGASSPTVAGIPVAAVAGAAAGSTLAGETYDQGLRFVTDALSSETLGEEIQGGLESLGLNLALGAVGSKAGQLAAPYVGKAKNAIGSFVDSFGLSKHGLANKALKLSDDIATTDNEIKKEALITQLDEVSKKMGVANAAQKEGISVPTSALVDDETAKVISDIKIADDVFSQQEKVALNQFNERLEGVTGNIQGSQVGTDVQSYLKDTTGKWKEAVDVAYKNRDEALGEAGKVLNNISSDFADEMLVLGDIPSNLNTVTGNLSRTTAPKIDLLGTPTPKGEPVVRPKMSIDEVKNMRSRVYKKAEEANSPFTSGDLDKAALQRAYNATSDELDRMIGNVGSGEAGKLHKEASKLYGTGKNKLDPVNKKLLGFEGAEVGENTAFNRLNTTLKDSPSKFDEVFSGVEGVPMTANETLKQDALKGILRQGSGADNMSATRFAKYINDRRALPQSSKEYMQENLGVDLDALAQIGIDLEGYAASRGGQIFNPIDATNTYINSTGFAPVIRGSEWAKGIKETVQRSKLGKETLRQKLMSETSGINTDTLTADMLERAQALRGNREAIKQVTENLSRMLGISIAEEDLIELLDEELNN